MTAWPPDCRWAWYACRADRERGLLLNRTSKNLPKLYIEQAAYLEGVNVAVKALERRLGHYCLLKLSRAVPPEVLKAARDEFGEKIRLVRSITHD